MSTEEPVTRPEKSVTTSVTTPPTPLDREALESIDDRSMYPHGSDSGDVIGFADALNDVQGIASAALAPESGKVGEEG